MQTKDFQTKNRQHSFYAWGTATVILLAGCTTSLPQTGIMAIPTPTTKSVVSLPEKTPEQIIANTARTASENVVNGIVALFDAGDYNGVIKRLSGPTEIRAEDKDLQIRAFKYMAFSYCVTNRQTPCRVQFDKILKLDPTFDLAAGEKGHPQWQAVFDRVKKAQK